jgi:hypothetical protein
MSDNPETIDISPSPQEPSPTPPGYTPATEGNKNSNTTKIIIIVLAVILLCCCCSALIGAGIWLWMNGDSLMQGFGSLLQYPLI